MNFIKQNKELIIQIINILTILIPIIYLIFSRFKNRKKRKKLRFGHYLVAIILIALLISMRWGVTKIEKDILNDDPVNNNVDNPEVENPENENKNNPNYIGTTPKGYIIEKINGAYYIDDYLVVNKSYPLDENWVPTNTHENITTEICKNCIDKKAFTEWQKMKSDATAIGLTLYIASGYRSYDYQSGLYQSYVSRDGKAAADTYSARAGHSEHQSGLAFDLNSVDSSFAATNEGKWVEENAHLYGFIIRYPKDKTSETGYKYEPWHLRYVGLDLAKKLYNNGNWITMESYYGIDSKYS